ncbi:MAG: B12-binding domain-containing radical SAM protein [Candidatus Omnitrophica bacterium]|nr:B12-binding domain-containing radical SAM protein [Candidatus Omnitrophota bacterium]
MPIKKLNATNKRIARVAFVFMNNNCLPVGKGAGYVIGAILEAGFPVTFYDTSLKSVGSIAADVIRQPFDVLMISTMSQFFPEVIKFAKKVKRHRDIPILIGGIHPTSVGKTLLEKHPEIDFLCIGEGESMVVDFLNHLGTESLFEIQNLAYRSGSRPVVNTLRFPENLEKLPAFPWHKFEKDAKYTGPNITGPIITASRGCPYKCTFCGNSVYLQHYGKAYLRFRPISHVIDELSMLAKNYSVSCFYFSDEMMLSNSEYVCELLKAVKRLNIKYFLQGRTEWVNGKLVETLKDTGCAKFFTGVECGNEKFRKKHLNRHMSNKQIMSAFSLLRKAGIAAVSGNMIGFPFEEDRRLTKETIEFNLALRPAYASFNIFYPYPGTELHKYCIDNDLIDPVKEANYTRDQDSILKGITVKKQIANIVMFLNHKLYKFRKQ